MLSSWLANRALDIELRAMERHYRTRSAVTLLIAETAEDVRLWIDRYADWPELRVRRERLRRQSKPPADTSLQVGVI